MACAPGHAAAEVLGPGEGGMRRQRHGDHVPAVSRHRDHPATLVVHMQVEVLARRDGCPVAAGQCRVHPQSLGIGANQEARRSEPVIGRGLGEVADMTFHGVHGPAGSRLVVLAQPQRREQNLVGLAEDDRIAGVVQVPVVVNPLVPDVGVVPGKRRRERIRHGGAWRARAAGRPGTHRAGAPARRSWYPPPTGQRRPRPCRASAA
jgi:hypothetical protein